MQAALRTRPGGDPTPITEPLDYALEGIPSDGALREMRFSSIQQLTEWLESQGVNTDHIFQDHNVWHPDKVDGAGLVLAEMPQYPLTMYCKYMGDEGIGFTESGINLLAALRDNTTAHLNGVEHTETKDPDSDRMIPGAKVIPVEVEISTLRQLVRGFN